MASQINLGGELHRTTDAHGRTVDHLEIHVNHSCDSVTKITASGVSLCEIRSLEIAYNILRKEAILTVSHTYCVGRFFL